MTTNNEHFVPETSSTAEDVRAVEHSNVTESTLVQQVDSIRLVDHEETYEDTSTKTWVTGACIIDEVIQSCDNLQFAITSNQGSLLQLKNCLNSRFGNDVSDKIVYTSKYLAHAEVTLLMKEEVIRLTASSEVPTRALSRKLLSVFEKHKLADSKRVKRIMKKCMPFSTPKYDTSYMFKGTIINSQSLTDHSVMEAIDFDQPVNVILDIQRFNDFTEINQSTCLRYAHTWIDIKGSCTFRKHSVNGRLYSLEPLLSPIVMIAEVADTRILGETKKFDMQDINNFFELAGDNGSRSLSIDQCILTIKFSLVSGSLKLENSRDFLFKARRILVENNYILRHRYEWVCKRHSSDKYTFFVPERISNVGFVLIYKVVPVSVIDKLSYVAEFWLYLASLTYDFPEFSAEELNAIEPFAVFTMLLAKGAASAWGHLQLVLCLFKLQFKYPQEDAMLQITKPSYISQDLMNDNCVSLRKERAMAMAISQARWKPLLFGCLLVIFKNIPVAAALEVQNQKTDNQWYVIFTIFLFCFKSLYDLFRARKEITNTIMEVFDIESPLSPIERAVREVKTKSFRSESLTIPNTLMMRSESILEGMGNTFRAFITAAEAIVKGLKAIETGLIDSVLGPMGIKDPSLRDFLASFCAHTIFATYYHYYKKKKKDKEMTKKISIMWAMYSVIDTQPRPKSVVYMQTDDYGTDAVHGLGIQYDVRRGQFMYSRSNGGNTVYVDEYSMFNSESYLEDLGEAYGNLKNMQHSPMGKSVKTLLEAYITERLDLDEQVKIDKFWKSVDVIDNLTNVMIHVAKAYVAYNEGADINQIMDVLMDRETDLEYVDCKKIADGVASGNFINEGHNPQAVLVRFEKLLNHYKGRLGMCSKRDHPANLHKTLVVQEWISELIAKEIQGKPKMQPFAVTLWGEPGVGKSYSIEPLANFLHVNHKLCSGESYPERIGFMNPDDKYDSNLDSSTTCIVMNDIGVILHEKRETPVMTLLKRMCDSIIEPFVKADVESKGKCFNMAKLIIVTTNAKDGGTSAEATDPGAASRRLGLKLHMKLRDEFKTPEGLPDRDKLCSREGMLPDHCTYSAYDLVGNPPYVKYIKENMDAEEAMLYIKLELSKHVKRYHNSKESKSDASVYCNQCGMPLVVCNCMNSELSMMPIRVAYANATQAWEEKCFAIYAYYHYHYTGIINLLTTSRMSLHIWTMCIITIVSVILLLCNNIYSDSQLVCIKTENIEIVGTWPFTRSKVNVVETCNREIGFSTYVNLTLSFILTYVLYFLYNAREIFKTAMRYVSRGADFYDNMIIQIHMTKAMIWKNRFNIPAAVLTIYALNKAKKKFFPMVKNLINMVSEQGLFGSLDIDPIEQVFADDSAEQKFYSVEERKELMGKDVPWAPVIRNYPSPDVSAVGCTIEQCVSLVTKNIVQISWKHEGGIGIVHGLLLETGVMIAPLHAVDSAKSKGVPFVIHDGFKKISILLDSNSHVDIPEYDAALIAVNAMGSKKSLIKFLSDDKFEGSGQAIWIRATKEYIDSKFCINFGSIQSKPIIINTDNITADMARDKSISGYKYQCDTYNGACGSPILVSTKRGPVILGLHIAGTGTEGGACSIALSKVLQKLGELRELCPSAIAGTEKRMIKHFPEMKQFPVPEPHPKNAVHFVPLLDGNVITVYGDVGTDYSPSGRVVPSIYKDIAKKYFPVPDLVPRNIKNRACRQELLLNGTAPMPPISQEILRKSIDDYLDLPNLTRLIDEDIRLGQPWMVNRFYLLDEVLNGIDGHPYRNAIKSSTSAGWPYNKAKSKVMLGDSLQGWKLKAKEHDELFNMFDHVFGGYNSGLPYKCTEKDEGCLPEKVDRVRLFQAGNMVNLIFQLMVFGPAIDFMTAHPEFFELAIGVNPHDVSWHNVVAEAFVRFNNGFEFDFSKYDQTQHPDIKAATGKVVAKLTQKVCGFPDCVLPQLERACYEFVNPLINIFGVMAELPNIMPSGTLTTAHGNCIYNSLTIRMSVFTAIPELDCLRRHMAFRCLGDDNGGSFDDYIKKHWNQKIHMRYMNSIGMRVTDGSKDEVDVESIDNKRIVFLSRTTVYCPKRGHTVGLLLDKSLFKALAITNPSKVSAQQQLADVVRSTMIECYNCDEDLSITYYNNFIHFCDEVGIAFPDDLEYPLHKNWINLQKSDLGFKRRALVPEMETMLSEGQEMQQEDVAHVESSEVAGFTTTIDTVSDKEYTSDVAAQPMPYGDLGQYLNREYLVAEENFNPGGMEQTYFEPYKQLVNHPVLGKRLDNIALMRAGLELRFVCAATSMHSGSFLMSYTPMYDHIDFQGEGTFEPKFQLLSRSSRQSLFLRIGMEDSEAKLAIPYVFWSPYVNPRNATELGFMGRCYINVVSPITHALNNTVPVLIRVYGKLVDYSFSGATAFRSESFPDEKFSSKVSVLANMAGKAEALFATTAPALSVPAGVVKNTLDGISGAARLFGHSRPISNPTISYIPSTTTSMSVTNGNLPAKVLSLDLEQGVSISGLVGGSNANDTSSHDFLLSKKVLVGVFPVSGDIASNTVVFECGVTPAFCLRSGTSNMLTPAGIIASQYNLWCGTVNYQIVISRNQMTGGKLVVFHDPMGAANNTLETNKSLLFDIRDTNCVDISVGWTVPDLMLRTNSSTLFEPLEEGHIRGYTNGSISLRVHSPIVGSGAAVPTIYVELYTWCDVDTVFADHTNYLGRYEIRDSANLVGAPQKVYRQPNRKLAGLFSLPEVAIQVPLRDTLLEFEPRSILLSPIPDWRNVRADPLPTMPIRPDCCSSDLEPDPVQTEPTLAPAIVTSAPILTTNAPSSGENSSINPTGLWSSLFPSKISSGEPSVIVKDSAEPTILNKVDISAPTIAPVNISTNAPTLPPPECSSVISTISPWACGCDGHVILKGGQQIINTIGATILYIPCFVDYTGNGSGKRSTTVFFSGSLVIDGVSKSSSYTFPLPSNNRYIKANITGSNAEITKVNTPLPVGTEIVEIPLSDLEASYTSRNGKFYTEVQVASYTGEIFDGIKLGSVGNSQYLESINNYYTYTTKCPIFAWSSCVFEGTIRFGYGEFQGLYYPSPTREFPTAYAAPTNGVEFSTPTVLIVIRAFQLRLKMMPSEGTLVTSTMPDVIFNIGIKPNTTEILAICAGERMNSMRSLMQVPKPTGLYEVTESALQFSKPLYSFADEGTNITEMMLFSHVGVRGGVVSHLRLLGEGQVIAYRPLAKDMPEEGMFARGYEILDSRVNPTMSVKFPYYNQSYFYMSRSDTQPLASSYPERGYQVYKTSSGTLYLSELMSVAEDFCLIQFIGCPLLQRR